MYTNGAVFNASFSTFMFASQNPELIRLVEKDRNGGALPLDQSIGATEVKYQTISTDETDIPAHGAQSTGFERMAFRLA